MEEISDYPKYTCRKVESALKTQVETQAQTAENLIEKASAKESVVLLSPKDDYSLAITQSRKQQQRFSIMSPRLVPTAQIDLANKQRQVYTRLGQKPLKLKKKMSKNSKTNSN